MKLRWLLVSLLLHLLLLLSVRLNLHQYQTPPDVIDVDISYDKMVVDTNPAPNDDPGEFLSSKNQKVKDQTTANNPSLQKFIPKFDYGHSDQPKEEVVPTGSSEFVPGITQGNETLLSTKEFQFYTYFSRIRQQVGQHWIPTVRGKISDVHLHGDRLTPYSEFVTRCLVILDKGGRLIKIQVLKSSGVGQLDEAAIESFQRAASFPNPPKELVNSNGMIEIGWDFIVQSGRESKKSRLHGH